MHTVALSGGPLPQTPDPKQATVGPPPLELVEVQTGLKEGAIGLGVKPAAHCSEICVPSSHTCVVLLPVHEATNSTDWSGVVCGYFLLVSGPAHVAAST